MGCLVSKSSRPSTADAQPSRANPVKKANMNHESASQRAHEPNAVQQRRMETPPQSSSVALQNTENRGNGISIPTMERPLDAAQPNQSESLKESEHTSSAREDVPKVSAQPLEPAISSTDAGATQPLDRSPDAAVAMGAIILPFRVKDHPNGGNGADKKPTGDPPRNALGQLSGAVGISNGAPDEPHEMRPVERESSINAGMEAQQLALPAEVEDEFVSDTNERENEALRSAMSVRDHTTVDSLEDNNVVLNATGVEGRALTVGPGGEGAVLSAGSDAEKDPNALQENLEGGICANNKNDPERPILFDRSAVQIKKVPSTERVEMKRQWHQLISQDTRTPQTIHEEGTCPSMLSIGDETVMETQQGGNRSVHAIHVLEKRDGADKASVVPGGVEATKNHVSEELLYVTQITDMVRNLSKAEPEIFVEQQRGEHTRVEPVSQDTTPRDLVGVRHLPECIDDEVLEEGAYSVAESTDEELGNIGTDMPSDSVSSGRKLMLGGDCSVLVHGTDKSHVSDAAMLAVRKSEEKEDPTTQNLPQGKESTQKHNDHGQSTTEISRKSEFDMIDDAVEKEAFVQVADWRSSDMRNSSSHANSSSAAIRQHKELRTLQSRIPEQMKCSQLVTDPGIASIIPRQSSEHGQRKGAETSQEIIAEENMDIYGFRSFRHGCAVAQETPVTGGDPPETEGTSSAQVFASKDVLNEENDTQKEHAAASSIVRADEDENHAACDEGHQAVEKREENLCPSTNGTEHSVCSDGAGALQQASGIVGNRRHGASVPNDNNLSEIMGSPSHEGTKRVAEREVPGHLQSLARELGSTSRALMMTSQKRDNPLLEMLPASENEAQHPIGQPVTTAVRLEEKAAMSPFKSNAEAATEQQKLGQETGSEKIQHVRSKNPYVLEGSSSSSHYSSEARSPPKLAKSMKDAEETVHEYSSQGKDFDNTRNPSIQRRVLHAPRNLLENDSNDTPTIEGSAMETLTNELHAPTDVANPIEQMRNLERKLEKLMQTMGIQQTAVMPTTSSIVSRESKPVPIPTDWDYESTYYGQCDEYVWRNPPPRNLGSGMNGYGNRWTNLRGGGYHYANHGTDGGFYIRNSDGSSYHFSPSRGGSFRPA